MIVEELKNLLENIPQYINLSVNVDGNIYEIKNIIRGNFGAEIYCKTPETTIEQLETHL